MAWSRSQLLVYGAIAVAVLLVGSRWLRGAPVSEEQAVAAAPFEVRSGGGGGGRNLVVHVAGAVRKPGVYRLPAGARVADAVERAGGPRPGAAVDGVNLAAKLSDGQQIVVPEKAATPVGAGGVATPGGPISLGSATVEQLETIPGIGPATAAEILAFRDGKGGLSSVDQLDEVPGIGPAKLAKLRERLQP